MEAASTTAAQGRAEAPSLRAARRRWGEDLIKALLMLAALISVLTTLGIIFSLLGETISFLGDVGIADFLFGTDWSPLFEPASFGVLPLVVATFVITAIAMVVAVPDRTRSRDLPVGVRAPRRAQDDQADPRAAGGRAHDRVRLLRAHLLHARDPARAPRRGHLQRPGRGHHHRLPDRAHRGLDLRGLDVGGAPVAARGLVRTRRLQAPDHPARGLPGRAVRASWRRSCWASRAPWARPWSW